MASAPARIFEFGRFRLDTGQGVLLRDSQRVALTPKAVDLLAALVAEAGRVISKDQLLERVWPDAFVQEGNLSKLVFLLRRELEQAPGAGAIETVSKRGYVYTGPVRELTGEVTSEAPAPRSLAVLPFATLHEETAAHLGESVAEEVLGALSRIRDLSVVARTSSFRVPATQVDVREMGRQLRVAWIVEGTVRLESGRVRATAALIDASTAFQRWSQAFERPVSELSMLPEAIASQIAAVLLPVEAPSAPAQPVVDPAAYDLYLQGRYFWNRRPGQATWRALECFEQATRRDPRFAQAWAGIADVYSTLGSWEAGVLPHDEAQRKAREYAERALALDPHLAEALTTLAYTALHYDWDPQAADAGFARALRENPAYAAAHHWRSHALIAQERIDESLVSSRVALSHDPMNILLTAHFAWHHHMARQPELALEQSERVVRLDPHFHWGHYFLSWAAEGVGDTARAVDAARAAIRCMERNPVMQAVLGRALAMAGDRAGALAVADAVAQEDQGYGRYAYELALIHIGLGDQERALELLARARVRRSGWMVYAHVDPRMDPLRADPRFAGVLPVRTG